MSSKAHYNTPILQDGIGSPKSIYKNNGLLDYPLSSCPNNPIGLIGLLDYQQKRKELLDFYKQKQSYKVAIGKSKEEISKWIDYENFDPKYNLRQILNDEIVIEFDTTDQNISFMGINFTGIELYKAGISFEVWDHGGKSPHLHIHNLPIGNLSAENRITFKKLFIRKYVPKEYLQYVDYSLTGIHVIAIEWAEHWKGCYGVKILLHKFNPKEDNYETN